MFPAVAFASWCTRDVRTSDLVLSSRASCSSVASHQDIYGILSLSHPGHYFTIFLSPETGTIKKAQKKQKLEHPLWVLKLLLFFCALFWSRIVGPGLYDARDASRTTWVRPLRCFSLGKETPK